MKRALLILYLLLFFVFPVAKSADDDEEEDDEDSSEDDEDSEVVVQREDIRISDEDDGLSIVYMSKQDRVKKSRNILVVIFVTLIVIGVLGVLAMFEDPVIKRLFGHYARIRNRGICSCGFFLRMGIGRREALKPDDEVVDIFTGLKEDSQRNAQQVMHALRENSTANFYRFDGGKVISRMDFLLDLAYLIRSQMEVLEVPEESEAPETRVTVSSTRKFPMNRTEVGDVAAAGGGSFEEEDDDAQEDEYRIA